VGLTSYRGVILETEWRPSHLSGPPKLSLMVSSALAARALSLALALWAGAAGAAASSEALARSAASPSSGSLGEAVLESLKGFKGVPRAIELARLEQELEDLNVMYKYDGRLERVLLVMPLTEQFDPPMGQFGQGHVQTSDRVSLPKSVMMEVIRRSLDVPWQFEIHRMHRRGPGDYVPVKLTPPSSEELEGAKEMPQLAKVTGSILDYRSPEQYLFVPDWMMKSLRLRPRDMVRLKYKRMPQGAGCVYLQAHTSDLAKLSNADKVLEEELRHYSSLTAGTTISFVFNPSSRRNKGANKCIEINIVKCLDGEGREVDSVCIQDSDVSTEWLPPLDTPEAKKGRSRIPKKPVDRRKRKEVPDQNVSDIDEEEEST
jgi:hypothetical protein